jgi:hypothetical protein
VGPVKKLDNAKCLPENIILGIRVRQSLSRCVPLFPGPITRTLGGGKKTFALTIDE